MSHTERHGGFTFHFNPDMSGDVVIEKTPPRRYQTKGTDPDLVETTEEDYPEPVALVVPGRVLQDFVAERVREALISKIEGMSTDELLNTIE